MRLRHKLLTAKPRIVKEYRHWWADRLNPKTGKPQCELHDTFREAIATVDLWSKQASC
ncbi:hypothetical protein [Paenarthrobacter nitroguajacolicus]|uniref:hypothetical protein n=1 Tax=Paenarthrobacter nitroguajacolicus TaxID=211146 RepID=UPI00248C96F4|nr:hypothetical protein [Paenarthrobacter nitroguajacolicus]MDI2032969.1 hypothetical protein [Paenarthrobacter nitroguajacolicus]